MAYVQLTLPSDPVSAVISMAAEPHLKQAHYLLASKYSDCDPEGHFGSSAVVMTLLSIAAASVARYFDPKINRNDRGDRNTFTDCVCKFFPWNRVTIEDDQYRPAHEQKWLATNELYSVFRNPLVHSGGMTSKPHFANKIGDWYRRPKIVHVLPGHASLAENEKALSDYCISNLDGDVLMKLEAFSSSIYPRPLYWCARRMIESFATDGEVQSDIRARHGL